MHILFITELYPEYEGQSPLEKNSALHDFVKSWKASGVQVSVIVPTVTRHRFAFGRASVEKSYFIDDVLITQITMPKMPGFKYYNSSAIVRFSRTVSFDVIVSHMQIGLVAGAAVKKNSGKCLIFGVHRSDNTVLDIPNPNLKKRIFKRVFSDILQRVDGFAFRSFSVQKQFSLNYPIADTPQTIALSGIPLSLIHSDPDFAYARTPRIITACKLIRQKHVDSVLEALSMLPETLSWRYTIIGDGPERTALETLVKRNHLDSRVTFLGRISRDENIRIMRDADIFVMVSDKETLGMVYLEALAQGLLTIASRGTGVDGFIRHGENGYLCPPGNAPALAKELERILHDRPETVRKKGYQSILDTTQTTCAARYLSFISNIVGKTTTSQN